MSYSSNKDQMTKNKRIKQCCIQSVCMNTLGCYFSRENEENMTGKKPLLLSSLAVSSAPHMYLKQKAHNLLNAGSRKITYPVQCWVSIVISRIHGGPAPCHSRVLRATTALVSCVHDIVLPLGDDDVGTQQFLQQGAFWESTFLFSTERERIFVQSRTLSGGTPSPPRRKPCVWM